MPSEWKGSVPLKFLSCQLNSSVGSSFSSTRLEFFSCIDLTEVWHVTMGDCKRTDMDYIYISTAAVWAAVSLKTMLFIAKQTIWALSLKN